MSEFSIIIKESLNEFKSIYRREIPKEIKHNLDINDLAVKRNIIRNASDINLYEKAANIIKFLERKTNSCENIESHQGIERFTEHLKNIISTYRIYNERIIHSNQYSCEALIRAIQIISLYKVKLNSEALESLKKCCSIIIEINNPAHIKKLRTAIKTYYNRNPKFFNKAAQHCKNITQHSVLNSR